MRGMAVGVAAALALGMPALAPALTLGMPQVAASDGDRNQVVIALERNAAGLPDDLVADLADPAAHARAGLNAARIPASLTVAIDALDGEPAVRVQWPQDTGTAGDFAVLLALDWPQGRLTRAYRLADDGGVEALDTARYGPVRSTDTLYSIADLLRPAPLAINQMMLALLDANPRAFNAPNVNALRRDAELRVPAPEALNFPEAAVADQTVRRQIAAWPDVQAEAQLAEGPVGTSSEPTEAVASAPPAASPQLRLLPPVPAEAEAVTGEQIADLAEQLDAVQAANARLEADNQRLESTLGELRDDMARLETLLKRPVDTVPLAESPAEAPMDASATLTGADVLAWMQSEIGALWHDPQRAMQRPFVQGVVATLGGLLVLVMALVLLGMRRRRNRLQAAGALPGDWRPGRPLQTEHGRGEVTVGAAQARPGAADAPIDPLERASELVAYGQLESAQSILDEALGETPDSVELRARLLDVLAMRGDRAGFEAEAHVLHAQLGDEADPRWQRVVRQGRDLSPGHPLFSAPE